MMLLANSGKALQRSANCQEFGFRVRFQVGAPAASDMTAEFANSIVLWRDPKVESCRQVFSLKRKAVLVDG
jgi:hypothetical protein